MVGREGFEPSTYGLRVHALLKMHKENMLLQHLKSTVQWNVQ